jgi:hypothetical protein
MPERSPPERRNGLHRLHTTSGPSRGRPSSGHDGIGAVGPLATRWAVLPLSKMGIDI